jgi:predicted HTH domain antitoxin
MPTTKKTKIHCKFDKMVSVAEMKPNPNNPNKHSPKQIRLLSIILMEAGWRVPITVSKRSGMIVRGHGRLMAAEQAGMEVVPVQYQAYRNDDEELADLIADNRISELAKMEKGMLRKLLADYQKRNKRIELTGFDMEDLKKLIPSMQEQPEIEISAELFERHDYILMVFDNHFDWNVACEKFGVKTVRIPNPPGSKLRDKFPMHGVGRVMRGKDVLRRLEKEG